MGKTFVRGKEKYSLAEKKELGELVEKYKKEYDKEVKAICHFLCKSCLLGQTKRKGILLTIFRPPPDIPTPLLIRTPPPHRLFGTLEYIYWLLKRIHRVQINVVVFSSSSL